MLTVAVLRTNLALATTFVALIVTFVLLTSSQLRQHSHTLERLGGWMGLLTAGLAFYTGVRRGRERDVEAHRPPDLEDRTQPD